MPRNEQIFKTILNRPWALHPAKLEEIGLLLERRLAGEKLEWPEAAAVKSGNKSDDAFEVRDGVAILPVYGIIDKRMNMFMRFSGGTSTELLARDFKKALADPAVVAILLDVDSPGGSVDGIKEVADLIMAAREVKAVVAYANGLMASAAYWIGSAAQAIVAPATAEIGSIGVALLHYDYSGADEQEGVKRTFITGGKYKRIASDEKPLSKEGREYLQAMVDDYYGIFVEAVAEQRGTDPETVQEKMADGRIFVGKKALKAGLVDKIGTLESALALAKQLGGQKNMDIKKLETEHAELFAQVKALGAAGVTLETLLKEQPEVAEKLRGEGRETGVKVERARSVKILERAGLQGLTLELIREGSTYEAALEKMVSHLDQMKAEALKTLGAQAPPPVGSDPPKVENFTEPEQDAPIETRAKADWDKDPALREQYMNRFEAYLAYKRGKEAGTVKILGKK